MSVSTAVRHQHHHTRLGQASTSSSSSGVSGNMSAQVANEGEERRSGSLTSSNGSASSGGGGILANAHEAPKRNGSQSGIRSALKAAFVPPQPGKQMKTGGKALGKTFHRKEPLPQKHEGGEILRVDPRGPNAPCGDGVVLESSGDEGEEDDEISTDTGGPGSATSTSQDGSSSNDLLSPKDNRKRSETVSTQYSDASADSRGNPCSIKFAPLPSSGRLKRANSITIGVAARSQLLHSQGAGRNVNGNAQLWQQHQQQQQKQRQARAQQSDSSASTSRQPIPLPEQVDIGEELRKGAMKAWDRVRRGSSASRGNDEEEETSGKKDVSDEADTSATGDKTPKQRAQSPVQKKSGDDSDIEDGAQTPPRKNMQRRVSTGAFTGHASFSQIEERRKRGDSRSSSSGAPRHGDDERENEATRFIEMLGSTGAGREAFHDARVEQKRDGSRKVVDVVALEGNGDTNSDDIGATAEGDDEEEREALELADQALKGHSKKVMNAGGVEKMEKKS